MRRGWSSTCIPQLKHDGAKPERGHGVHVETLAEKWGMEHASRGWAEGVIASIWLKQLAEEGRIQQTKEESAGGPGSQKAHLVVSVS